MATSFPGVFFVGARSADGELRAARAGAGAEPTTLGRELAQRRRVAGFISTRAFGIVWSIAHICFSWRRVDDGSVRSANLGLVVGAADGRRFQLFHRESGGGWLGRGKMQYTARVKSRFGGSTTHESYI